VSAEIDVDVHVGQRQLDYGRIGCVGPAEVGHVSHNRASERKN